MKTKFDEKSNVVNGTYELKGTMITPKNKQKKYPTVVLVAGSGEIDRNGNSAKMNLNINIYKELAEVIASLGFITYRYDKRGVGESGGNYLETGMWDLVNDLAASVEWLKKQPQVDEENIILLGHSEGCILITAAYSKCKPSGMIMLSGAAERLTEAIKRQREIAFSELLNTKGIKGKLFKWLKIDQKGEAQAQKQIKRIKASNTDTIKYNLTKLNAKWQREHFAYDVYEDLKKVDCPVLAITGDKDFQANPERLANMPNLIKGEAECCVIKNMDHILKEFTGKMSALNFRKQYKSEADQPIHSELTKCITQWLLQHYQS